jgi:thiol:disulfide interchange protein DsbA
LQFIISETVMLAVARHIVFLAAMLVASGAWAQTLVEGRDFTRIVPALQTTDSAKIEVTEFFSYQCPHCFMFAAPFKRWSATQPKDVVCRREAVSIGYAAWEPSARAFYALQSMQKLAAVDDAFFDAVHAKRIPLQTEAQIAAWLQTRGVASQEFSPIYRSFLVDTQFRRGQKLSIASKLPSVPAITIDGKYLIAIASNVDFGKQLAVVDALIARARAEKQRAMK